MAETTVNHCGATITAKISDATNEFSIHLQQHTVVGFDETLTEVVNKTHEIIKALIAERSKEVAAAANVETKEPQANPGPPTKFVDGLPQRPNLRGF